MGLARLAGRGAAAGRRRPTRAALPSAGSADRSARSPRPARRSTCPALDRRADGHRRGDRFVGGPQPPPWSGHDYPDPGHHAGEGHDARRRPRAPARPRRRRGRPRGGRRPTAWRARGEAPEHRGGWTQRPREPRRHRGSGRPGGCGRGPRPAGAGARRPTGRWAAAGEHDHAQREGDRRQGHGSGHAGQPAPAGVHRAAGACEAVDRGATTPPCGRRGYRRNARSRRAASARTSGRLQTANRTSDAAGRVVVVEDPDRHGHDAGERGRSRHRAIPSSYPSGAASATTK